MSHSRRPQYVTSAGWLSEDGITDELAAWMAAYDRLPELTYREALLATYYMMRDSKTSEDIALRLNSPMDRATGMMKRVRDGILQTF